MPASQYNPADLQMLSGGGNMFSPNPYNFMGSSGTDYGGWGAGDAPNVAPLQYSQGASDAGMRSNVDWLSGMGGLYDAYTGYQQQQQLGSLKGVQQGAAGQLQALLGDPSKITSMPGYQASQDAAMQALTRQLASQGLTGSGTAAQAIATEGAQFQHQYYMDMLNQLGILSGANQPYAAMQQRQQAGEGMLGGLGQIFGALGGASGIGDILGGIGDLVGGAAWTDFLLL